MSENRNSSLLKIYLDMRPALTRFLEARLRDSDAAQDIMQDIYLKISKAKLGEPVDNPAAFLYKVANNLVLDRRKAALRRQQRQKDWSDSQHSFKGTIAFDDSPDALAALDARQRLALVRQVVQKLPTQCRTAFEYHKFDGLTQREVAERMGVTVKTVEKHMARAMAQITALLADARDEK